MPVFIIGYAIFLLAGWVLNVVKFLAMIGDPTVTPMFVVRIIGIPFAPLGAVLGWF